ncbi:MAG: DUF1570 domain-containing protein [Phycisphaerales bacterium JB040]
MTLPHAGQSGSGRAFGRREALKLAFGAAPLALLAGCASSTDARLNRLIEEERERRRAASAAAMRTGETSPTARTGVVLSEEAWSFDRTPGRVFETANFRVFTTLDDSELIRRLPTFLEHSLLRYRQAVTPLPAPESKLVTYAMGSRTEWASLTRQLMGDRAALYLKINRGGFAAEGKGVYFDLGPRDTLAVAAHEGWHQYAQAVFRNQLPIWLDEGLSAWHEGFRWDRQTGAVFVPWGNEQRYDRLTDVVRRDALLPLADLLNARPQDLIETSSEATLDYYAQVWALAHFLHDAEGGLYRPVLAGLLEAASGGELFRRIGDAFGRRAAFLARTRRTGSEPLLAYLEGRDAGAVGVHYAAFVRHAVRPGARRHILEGNSPIG